MAKKSPESVLLGITASAVTLSLARDVTGASTQALMVANTSALVTSNALLVTKGTVLASTQAVIVTKQNVIASTQAVLVTSLAALASTNALLVNKLKPGTTRTIALATSTIALSSAVATQNVRIAATAKCFYVVATTPVATLSDAYLPADRPEEISIGSGLKVAAIASTAGGTVYVTDLFTVA